jgi:ABC-type multidrug transport system fused ATPase/permease subunit
LRIFGLADWIVEKFSREWSAVMGQLWQARRADYRVMSVLGVLVLGAHLVVVLLLARAASSGALSVAAVTVVAQGLFAMAALASQNGDVWIENGAVRVPDVLELERSVTPDSVSGGAADGMPREFISFQGVDFSYPGRADTPVLADFELRIEAGTSLAIVGLNGAGKTTLARSRTDHSGRCRSVHTGHYELAAAVGRYLPGFPAV